MRTIIHDLNEKELKNLKVPNEDYLVNSKDCKLSCMGCFSCWTKTPTHCIIKDGFNDIVSKIKDSNELVLISKCNYGCYSYSVKRVLERCIGYVLPYFTIRENRIHHESRYKKKITIRVIFYGDDITEQDKICAINLVKANSINLNSDNYYVSFINSEKEIKNVFTN